MANNENSTSERPWQSYHTVYTNAKAGMEGVDKEKVQRIVYEMSKGSKYFENEERKEAYMKQKIEKMRERRAELTPADIAHYQQIADKRIVELEATRDLSRIWIHVDMDAFYAAAETLCDPSLEGKPMAVGGLSMLSTANYEARKFGVRAAMPGFIARKLCPQLILVPTDFKKYNYYSDLTRKVFQKYDPSFIAASLDEAYLDITDLCSERGMTGGEVAEELRESVHKETGLTCSAGVAPNRLLAKVCSDINKPNGQFVLPNEHMAVMTFISSLPIRKIGGIGKVTENVLKDVFGIATCEDMLQKSSLICALFSRTSADFFLSVGLGLGRTDTPEVTMRKSISSERTFSSTEDEASLYQKLGELAENLSMDMKKEGLCGRTLTLKLKTSCFEVRTRAVTLPTYICSNEEILRHGMKLLKAELPVSLRLMGLRISQLNEGGKGVTTDPKQKTLSNFIVSEDASGRRPETQTFLSSNVNDDTLYTESETSFFGNTHGTCDSIDLQVHQIPAVSNIFLHIDDWKDKVDNDDTVKGPTAPFFVETADLVERNLSPAQFEAIRTDQQSRVNSCSNDELEEPVFWLDDYRCSVCGIEMPPSFVEERREHYDFHFAERLQKEESSSSQRILNSMQRFTQKDQMGRGRQKKKLKGTPSEGKHIPIDMFFAKTRQDL